MENKKLLNFLLKDLTEIDELFSEKNNKAFDKLEMEFIQDRLKGAKKLVRILIERDESTVDSQKKTENVPVQGKIIEEVIEKETLVEIETTNPEPEPKEEQQSDNKEKDEIPEQQEEVKEEIVENIESVGEVELEEETIENPNKRLGDLFLKEKSVNDILADANKLENKLSNRPVENIQTAIGINDRFQYIRELFEGNAGEFAKTVEQLDGMGNLKEAVQYLQLHFKWKKTETSLKFVNLIKRRFPNE